MRTAPLHLPKKVTKKQPVNHIGSSDEPPMTPERKAVESPFAQTMNLEIFYRLFDGRTHFRTFQKNHRQRRADGSGHQSSEAARVQASGRTLQST